jgi:transcriptional regulator with XRE-family HTH domain
MHAFWRLKRLREIKGITLEALAARSGLTKSYLSKVERGVSIPSLATALKLAEAFDVGVGDLFGVEASTSDYVVVRKNERKPIRRRGQRAGYSYETVAPAMAHGLFETFISHPPLKKDVARNMPRIEHGGQELYFVLAGTVEMSFPNATVKLAAGDCLRFNGRMPHRTVSLGSKRAEALVIITNEKEIRR